MTTAVIILGISIFRILTVDSKFLVCGKPTELRLFFYILLFSVAQDNFNIWKLVTGKWVDIHVFSPI